jgi:hypothetical protein
MAPFVAPHLDAAAEVPSVARGRRVGDAQHEVRRDPFLQRFPATQSALHGSRLDLCANRGALGLPVCMRGKPVSRIQAAPAPAPEAHRTPAPTRLQRSGPTLLRVWADSPAR